MFDMAGPLQGHHRITGGTQFFKLFFKIILY
jgi:hypothetical protein